MKKPPLARVILGLEQHLLQASLSWDQKIARTWQDVDHSHTYGREGLGSQPKRRDW